MQTFWSTILNWVIKHIDTLIAAFSALIALLTLINTSGIKKVVKFNVIQEQFTVNRDTIKKNLIKCQRIAQAESVRPANDATFNELMAKSLSAMERYFSLHSASVEYKRFNDIKQEMMSLLSVRTVQDPEEDIKDNAGCYGRLIGGLEELLENGRVS